MPPFIIHKMRNNDTHTHNTDGAKFQNETGAITLCCPASNPIWRPSCYLGSVVSGSVAVCQSRCADNY